MEGQTTEVDEIKGNYFYKEWLKREGIPVIEDYYIKDVKTEKLDPWKRKGGLGVYLNLIGTEDVNDGYICEIPPGKFLKTQRHLFEEMIYIVSGNGSTSVWLEGGEPVRHSPKHPASALQWVRGSSCPLPCGNQRPPCDESVS